MQTEIKVLVVEDEPIILRNIMQKVSALGSHINLLAGVDNAYDALNYIENQRPHILFTDIELVGMNGLELIRIVKERYQNLFTVILSGYSHFNYLQTALRYSTDDYLLKPVDTDTLREVFERIYNKIIVSEQITNLDNEPIEEIEILNLARKIERYLQNQLNKNVTMEDLSKSFNYTPSYLSRIYKKEYGLSPIHHHIRMRIEEAKKLIRKHPTLDIKEVAGILGYEDARYFSRIFRQFTELSPSEWANTKKEQHNIYN